MKNTDLLAPGVYVTAGGQLLALIELDDEVATYRYFTLSRSTLGPAIEVRRRTFAARVRWDFSRLRRQARAALEAARALVRAAERSQVGAPDAYVELRHAVDRLPFAAEEAIYPT